MEPEKQSSETAADTTEAPAAAAQPTKRGGKRRRAGVFLLAILLLGGFFGIKWWVKSKTHITTDDAFIESHVHSVAARIPGMVKRVVVSDNQFVQKGDLLLEMDPTDYQAKVATAAASLEMARNETSGEYAQADAARATVSLEQARLDQAEMDLQRAKALYAKEVIPKEQVEKVETARKVAALKLREVEEAQRRAEAIAGLASSGSREARVAQRQAQMAEADLSLSYAKVFSPTAGYITRKSVEVGNYIQPGQPLMAVVRLDDVWVTANYKESQLTHVKTGQKVEFTVDAYPGSTFRGTVESIMAGTGASFSLLPPENATSNYVKVVQRIPVRIAVDKASDPEHHLRIGMSVVPSILNERKLGEIFRDLSPF